MTDLANKLVYMVVTSDDYDDGDRIFATRSLAQAHMDEIIHMHKPSVAHIHAITLEELYNSLPNDDDN